MRREKRDMSEFVLRAEEIRDDRVQLDDLVQKVGRVLNEQKTGLSRVLDKILVLMRLLKSYTAGRYRQIPASRIILVVAALLYIVSPFDAVFDFLPGGYLDDAAIVAWLFNIMRIEIGSFQDWEKSS
jgi:uncharacterized membrane protein YkvA (DUF1232 family)